MRALLLRQAYCSATAMQVYLFGSWRPPSGMSSISGAGFFLVPCDVEAPSSVCNPTTMGTSRAQHAHVRCRQPISR